MEADVRRSGRPGSLARPIEATESGSEQTNPRKTVRISGNDERNIETRAALAGPDKRPRGEKRRLEEEERGRGTIPADG